MWLIAAWLFYEQLEEADRKSVDRDPGVELVSRLSDLADRPLLIGALAICAYVVGSLSQYLWGPFRTAVAAAMTGAYVRRGGSLTQRLVRRPLGRLLGYWAVSWEVYVYTWEALHDGGEAPTDSVEKMEAIGAVLGTEIGPFEDVVALVARSVESDLDNVRDRLVGSQADYFTQVDRVEAEAELRLAISLPLIAISAVLDSVGSDWWVLLGVIGLVIFGDGLRHDGNFRALLVKALTEKRVTTPVLEKIEAGAVAYSATRASFTNPDRDLF